MIQLIFTIFVVLGCIVGIPIKTGNMKEGINIY
jgi:hypothetical protein